MKRIYLLILILAAFLFSCENTSDCVNETDYITDMASVDVFKGDSLHLPYDKILYAKSFTYKTELKRDTIFGNDTTVVTDTIYTNRIFGFSIISDTLEVNYLIKVDEETEQGNEKIGDEFNLVKIYVEDILIEDNIQNPYAVLTVYKGVFFSDCSSW